MLSGKSGRRGKRNYWSALALVGGGANAGCYAGVLGGSIAALTSIVNCNTVLSDRKVASDVYLSGFLRNHRLVGFMTRARATRTSVTGGL